MDKTTWKTLNKMERQPCPPPGSCVAKNSQRPASVETFQGGVPPYGVKETMVVNGGKYTTVMLLTAGLTCPLPERAESRELVLLSSQ